VLELAHSNKLDWYSREMLEDAMARTDLELLYFIYNKKSNEFNWSFTTICARRGFIEVLKWWKEMELIQLFLMLCIVDNAECWIVCMRMDINKYPQI
jgi:hypothetical protein